MPKASKVMKELWKVKRELSKEIHGKTYEELKQWLADETREWNEDMKKIYNVNHDKVITKSS